ESGLKTLFGASDFKIHIEEVSKYVENSVYIKLDGEDCALLIGKEGYRYKALSSLLYNWINSKYNLNVRLEIAEFLKNQEAGMRVYLEGIIRRVEENGHAITKPLDGVLIKIALEQLRERFKDKYVGIKNSEEGKYILINDFYSR
ncbi:MAG: protein jag, partial [Campylobacter sp.]|nr:protein jag [Campylobacter sp.]